MDSVSVIHLSYTGVNISFKQFIIFGKVKVHLHCLYRLKNKMITFVVVVVLGGIGIELRALYLLEGCSAT
jgi:hypothetical protein